jgi:isoquinoline 1-oxidoreductase beta subunit
LQTKPSVTSPDAFEFIGKPYLHQDAYKRLPAWHNTQVDIRLPDMLYAAVLRPPVHGALLKSLNLDDAKKIEGVQIIEDDNFIALLHEAPDIARMALSMVKAEYDLSKPISQ